MRVGVISDIHGNRFGLEPVLADLERQGFDQIVCLGDICFGPQAHECLAIVRDLVELHALMAPRPFLVSGGTADLPERWAALNHAVAVNKLLGYENRVAMTNREGHAPTQESNEQVYRFFEWGLGTER